MTTPDFIQALVAQVTVKDILGAPRDPDIPEDILSNAIHREAQRAVAMGHDPAEWVDKVLPVGVELPFRHRIIKRDDPRRRALRTICERART